MTQVYEGTLIAWITSDWNAEGAMNGDSKLVLESVHLSHNDGMESCGWVRAGTARVEITLIDKSAIVENKVESLNAQKTQILAEAQMKATQIEEQIQKLLAITYEA